MKKRKTYNEAFKRKVVTEVLSGTPFCEVFDFEAIIYS
jgi:hypothetical protein